MAIISVDENPTIAAYAPARAKRGWNVLFDGTDGAAAMTVLAVQHATIPRVGTAHPNDPFQRSSAPEATWKSAVLVEVVVSYESPAGAGSGLNAGENPLNQPPEISRDWISNIEPVDTDFDGKPIINSAADPIDPQLQVEFFDPVYVITRNEPSDDVATALLYRHAVNSDVFWGRRPGQAFMFPIVARRIVQGDFVYWNKTYRIAFRDRKEGDVWSTWRELWYRRIADVGLNELAPDNNNLINKRAIRTEGNPITRPVPLENGRWTKGDVIKTWLPFRFVNPVPFAPLGLPQG